MGSVHQDFINTQIIDIEHIKGEFWIPFALLNKFDYRLSHLRFKYKLRHL